MGRLTGNDKGEGFIVGYESDLCSEICEDNDSCKGCIIHKLVQKLKNYEDIIDDPEKLKIIDALYLERCEEINRLKAELEEVRNKAVDEFAIEVKATLPIAVHRDCSEIDYEVDCALYSKRNEIDRIAKRMKEVQDVN